MLKLGITGGIGSGKSIICKVFKTLGTPVYEADTRAKELTSDPRIRKDIIELLGSEAYTSNGYNREYVAGVVFNNPAILQKINAIIHPAVDKDFTSWAAKHTQYKYVVKEAAILFESGAYKRMDQTVYVSAPESVRIKRVTKRDGVKEEQVRLRIQNQWSADNIRSLADSMIVNDEKHLVLPQILQIHNELINR